MSNTSVLSREEKVDIGTRSEAAFFRFADLINTHEIEPPPWLNRIEHPTGIEDGSDGVDAIVYTDRGIIPVQIKSSGRHIEEFKRKHPDFPGLISIVHPDEDMEVFGLTFLRELKHHYFSKQEHFFKRRT